MTVVLDTQYVRRSRLHRRPASHYGHLSSGQRTRIRQVFARYWDEKGYMSPLTERKLIDRLARKYGVSRQVIVRVLDDPVLA